MKKIDVITEVQGFHKFYTDYMGTEPLSVEEIDHVVDAFDDSEQEEFVRALRKVKRYLAKAADNIRIREFDENDVDYIINQQLALYDEERKFNSEIWTKYLIEGVHKLVEQFDADKDVVYIAECNGKRVGCMAVTHISDAVAQLRYFFLEPAMRGLGLGTELFDKAVQFCKSHGYSNAFLWTVSAQESARVLYKNAGFSITETSANEEWGVPVVEEKWELNLRQSDSGEI